MKEFNFLGFEYWKAGQISCLKFLGAHVYIRVGSARRVFGVVFQ